MAIISILPVDIINLITLFYYKNNHLRYQILLHLTGERTLVYGEYQNYKEYKEQFEGLQNQRKAQKAIQLTENEYRSNINVQQR